MTEVLKVRLQADYEFNLKLKIIVISLLIALTGFFIPVKTAAKPFVFSQENKQVALQQESVIYKTDAPIKQVNESNDKALRPNPKSQVNDKNKTAFGTGAKTTTDRQSSSGRGYSKEEVKALIVQYSAEYGIDSQVPLCIAYHESGYNSQSKNPSSTASGVFQYLSGTWKQTDEGKAGMSVYDAESNVKAAVKYMASRQNTNPWQVKNKCPKL